MAANMKPTERMPQGVMRLMMPEFEETFTPEAKQKIAHHALRLLLVAALSAVFLYTTRQVIIGASREIEYDLRNDLFANLVRADIGLTIEAKRLDINPRRTAEHHISDEFRGRWCEL